MTSVTIQKSLRTSIRGRSAEAIARELEAGIREGRFGAGAKLPSVRGLADALGVSPTTIAAAYRSLRARGLVAGDRRRGTSVRGRPPLRTAAAPPLPPHLLDLATGNPDPALLAPLGAVLQRIDAPLHLYAESHELPELRALAADAFEADGVPAEHLAVVSGALDGIERALTAHLRPGDRVGIEDPGFSNAIDLVTALGLVVAPIPIDERGLLPDALSASLADLQAVIVTPRAQNPTGAAIDAERARALRRVLRAAPDLLVIEDDHAGVVAGTPMHTLVGGRARWTVVRSTSKTHGPDLRLAVLAGDGETVARVAGRQRVGFRWVSHLLQRIVVEIESDPATRRRVAAAARAYTERRTALVAALAARGIRAFGASGMNVWVPVPEEIAVVQSLAASGIAVAAGERFRLRTGPAIRITISRLAPRRAAAVADAVAQALSAEGRSAAV
jgi:DNA-binding transcriptional MocR family regulator